MELEMKQALWVCRTLFERGKVNGSAANMSFKIGEDIYITKSGSCFGLLEEYSFFKIREDGSFSEGQEGKPSKELPLHLTMYRMHPEGTAVIHTHGPYATWWSCQKQQDRSDCVPAVTPYLKMRVGNVSKVSYAKPGSQELFDLFSRDCGGASCVLLERHGAITCGKTIMDAFYNIEELEDASRMLFLLKATDTNGLL